MQSIARYTSICVAIIYYTFLHGGMTYIVMKRLKGDIMGRVWLLRMADSKQCVLEQHMDMIAEMESVP